MDATLAQLSATTDVEAFCTKAVAMVQTLQQANDAERIRLEHECERLEATLMDTTHRLQHATTQLQEKQQRQQALHHALVQHQQTIRHLESDIQRDQAEIDRLSATIQRERQRQENALFDLIPGHGIFAAILSGDAKRAIPFYSQVDGLISVAEGERAAAENRKHHTETELARRQHEAHAVHNEITKIQRTIAGLEHEVADCRRKLDACRLDLKASGQKLTQARDVRQQLMALETTYQFTSGRIQLVQRLKSSYMMGRCLEDLHAIAHAA